MPKRKQSQKLDSKDNELEIAIPLRRSARLSVVNSTTAIDSATKRTEEVSSPVKKKSCLNGTEKEPVKMSKKRSTAMEIDDRPNEDDIEVC